MAIKRKAKLSSKRKVDRVAYIEKRAASVLAKTERMLGEAGYTIQMMRGVLTQIDGQLTGAPRNFLRNEIEAALVELRAGFRDGPVQINKSLIKLAQDILQEQIGEILRDQIQKLAKELALIAREEVRDEVYAAVREAVADEKICLGKTTP